MKSIKSRLVGNFMLIIIITVVILELLLIGALKKNYYRNLEENMTNQLRVSSELYDRYFSEYTLEENVLSNIDTFWKQTDAQVQIIDRQGKVLMDSIGVIPKDSEIYEDVREALEGRRGSWIGLVPYDDVKVIAVSLPLESRGKVIGALRFITSLREINRDIRQITYVFIAIGLLVVLISGFLSIFLSNTIVYPIMDVTKSAAIMAEGNFNIKVNKSNDDEIGRLSDTLNYMASEIVKRDELKNDFISSVSHELRTPLTSIKGWAITLQNKEFQREEILRDGLDIIEKESERLSIMVEELLDFSKFISGKKTMKKERLNLTGILEHIKKQLMPRAEREGIEFTVSYEEHLPIVIGDENRMKQVFINILDNSFNFTESGGKVNLHGGKGLGGVEFVVRDTGIGIPEEDLPKIKEKFYKGKSSKSKNGIGLSICEEIIRLMGGKLEIKSRLNEGTEVYITLPSVEEE